MGLQTRFCLWSSFQTAKKKYPQRKTHPYRGGGATLKMVCFALASLVNSRTLKGRGVVSQLLVTRLLFAPAYLPLDICLPTCWDPKMVSCWFPESPPKGGSPQKKQKETAHGITYGSILRWMNIHLQPILMFTRGFLGFDPQPTRPTESECLARAA